MNKKSKLSSNSDGRGVLGVAGRCLKGGAEIRLLGDRELDARVIQCRLYKTIFLFIYLYIYTS